MKQTSNDLQDRADIYTANQLTSLSLSSPRPPDYRDHSTLFPKFNQLSSIFYSFPKSTITVGSKGGQAGHAHHSDKIFLVRPLLIYSPPPKWRCYKTAHVCDTSLLIYGENWLQLTELRILKIRYRLKADSPLFTLRIESRTNQQNIQTPT